MARYTSVPVIGAQSVRTRAHALPSAPLFGLSVLLGVGALLVGTLLALAGAPGALAGALVLAVYAGVAFAHVARIGYLVFGTRGLGHYSLSPLRLIDALLGNTLAHGALTLAVWHAVAALGGGAALRRDGAAAAWGAWRAAAECVLYASVLYSGGGIVDVAPLHEAARYVDALAWLWQSVALLIFVAAAVAVVQTHTDEGAPAPP